MGRPEDIDLMAPSMDPIKHKIHSEEQQEKSKPIELYRGDAEIIIEVAINNINACHYKHIYSLVAQGSPEIGDCLRKGNVIFPENAACRDLKQDKNNRDRRQVGINISFLHILRKYTINSSSKARSPEEAGPLKDIAELFGAYRDISLFPKLKTSEISPGAFRDIPISF